VDVSAGAPNPSDKRVWIHGDIVRLTSHSVTFKRLSNLGVGSSNFTSDAIKPCEKEAAEETIEFDYCLYALGATLPSPVDTWTTSDRLAETDLPLGCKRRGVAFMEERGEMLRKAKSVIAVGGGALGIRKSVSPPLRY
jgi:hypothetical protein